MAKSGVNVEIPSTETIRSLLQQLRAECDALSTKVGPMAASDLRKIKMQTWRMEASIAIISMRS